MPVNNKQALSISFGMFNNILIIIIYIADKFIEDYSIDASRINTSSSVSDTPQSMATIEIIYK